MQQLEDQVKTSQLRNNQLEVETSRLKEQIGELAENLAAQVELVKVNEKQAKISK